MPAPGFLAKKQGKAKAKARANVQASRAANEPEAPKEVMILKPQAAAIVPGVERNTTSVAKNIAAAAISSGMKVDIDLESQLIGQLLGTVLKISVNNTTANDITVPKYAQEMIHNLKILANGGNTQICEFSKESLMYPLRYLDTATMARYKRGYESEDAEVVAAGESRTWYIPLLADPMALNRVFMQGVRDRFIYRVEFDKAAWTDGYPVLSDLSIISRHMFLSNSFMAGKRNADLQSVQDYNFRSFVAVNPNKIITAGATLEVRLDGFNRRASELYLQLWKNGQTLGQLAQYIDSFDLTDANNQSLIASGPIDSVYDDVILSAVHDFQPVIGSTRDSWTVLSFSPEPVSDFTSGESHGSRKFTGSELLKIKISASLPSADYQLRVYYGEEAKFRSAGGVLSLIASV
jgi:hypothetical protein